MPTWATTVRTTDIDELLAEFDVRGYRILERSDDGHGWTVLLVVQPDG